LEQIQIEDVGKWDTAKPKDFVTQEKDRVMDAKSLKETMQSMHSKENEESVKANESEAGGDND
jgi:hypothetical protein